MAPAIIGTLFNTERRQMPFLIEPDGFVIRALLHIAQEESATCGRKPFTCPESSGPISHPIASGCYHLGAAYATNANEAPPEE
jgi:hypothetical protein